MGGAVGGRSVRVQMAGDRTVSLTEILAAEPPERTRRGSLVFLGLNRELDRIIRKALALSGFHPGQESPWSHVVMLAADYAGPETPILESTIRTKDGVVAWDDLRPLSVLDILLGRCRSGVQGGTVGDYDLPGGVDWAGLLWLDEIGDIERNRLVETAETMERAGFDYDIGGLLRVAARLVSDDEARIPGTRLALSCSAFVAAAYHKALGPRGEFNAQLAIDQFSPDDIWYSARGQRDGPLDVRFTSRQSGRTRAPNGELGG